MSAAPIMAHTELVIMNSGSQTVYTIMSSFLLIWKIYHHYWFCKHVGNNKKSELRQTEHHLAYSVECCLFTQLHGDRKRKYIFCKMAAKRPSITTMRKKFPALATFHNLLHSHWSLPLSKGRLHVKTSSCFTL